MAITPASSRRYLITVNDHGNILDFGAANTEGFVGTFMFQFNPDVDFVGALTVMGRMSGPAAADASIPFMPVPYRRVTVNNVASDYTFASDQITGPSKIHVPSNKDAIGLLVACTAGTCMVCSWDLNGPSAV